MNYPQGKVVVTIAHVALSLLTIGSCAHPSAVTFYPDQILSGEGLAYLKSAHSGDADAIQVLLEDEVPKCKYVNLGTILYDWTKDNIITSKTTAIEGARKKSAAIGATGIYHLVFEPSRVSSSGSVAVNGIVSNSTVSVEEFGLKAIAYFCMPNMDATQKFPAP